MSILDVNLEDVQELRSVPEGEYRLVIEKMEVRSSAKGQEMLVVRYSVEGDVNAKNIFDYLILPGQYDDAARNQAAGRKIKRMCQAFNLPLSDIDMEDAVGSQGWVILSVEDYEGEDSNKIKRYVTGH